MKRIDYCPLGSGDFQDLLRCDQEPIMCIELSLKSGWLPLCLALLSIFTQAGYAASEGATQERSEKALGVPTHRQSTKLEVNADGRPKVKIACFCLTADDRILAGCDGSQGEIRVLNTDGKVVDSWSLPVKPEAIYAREDGAIFVAGEGQLLKLSSTGKTEIAKQAPQAKAIDENPVKLREEVVAQIKEQAKQLSQQTATYDKMIERADKEIEKIDEQVAAIDKAPTDGGDNDAVIKNTKTLPRTGANKTVLEQRRKMYTRQKDQYEQLKKQFAEMMGVKPGELTDAQIDEHVKASKAYKRKASSISALDKDVFLATHATLGYGFEVWRMDDTFENPTKIVKDLSGCCGQMDVKANKDGLYIAENSKHRVCHVDREGKSIGAWGESARSGLEGFGSCCNPMNVAFGPEGAVYTAEDDTGRIKRYSGDGKLLGLVGSVELKPGCKNCSISVSKDGSRVYMVDITRNFIVRLDARTADELAADIKNAPSAATRGKDAGSSLLDVIRVILPSDN
jgi:hypothetical protein